MVLKHRDNFTLPLTYLPIGAAAIREASSPAVVMNRKPPSASGTVISQPSSPVAAVGHKLIQKPKPLPLKEEDSHRNATHKVKGQNSGKIVWLECQSSQ
jgi:hypothetical protein